MDLKELPTISVLRDCIRICQMDNHVQQVAYSTYHDALTQICFTCNCVRTTIVIK